MMREQIQTIAPFIMWPFDCGFRRKYAIPLTSMESSRRATRAKTRAGAYGLTPSELLMTDQIRLG